MFVGGSNKASDWNFMQRHRITHVINCVSQTFPNHFEERNVKYLSLQITDTVDEDLTYAINSAINFFKLIEAEVTANSE